MDKAIQIFLLMAAMLFGFSLAKAQLDHDQVRLKRQSENNLPPGDPEGEAESGSGEPEEEGKKGGVSLGKILGLVFLTCCIIYCIGISWKVYKVCKGTYVEEEPVFLKYK